MLIPPLLQPGNQVALVAPAGRVDPVALEPFLETMAAWQLEVVPGSHLHRGRNYLAAPDDQRLADLQVAFDNPSIKAVICARGGYGTTRILDRLSFRALRQHPKWLVGFSDITALLLWLNRQGLAAIHGPMAVSFGKPGSEAALEALRSLLFEGRQFISAAGGRIIRPGVAEGMVTGGNLALLTDSLSTPAEVDTRGRILVVEEVGEPLYRIDRMLQQLKRAGKLRELQALVVGRISGIPQDDDFDYDLEDIIISLTRPYHYPVVMDWPVGHLAHNMPFVAGGHYRLRVSAPEASLEWLTAG